MDLGERFAKSCFIVVDEYYLFVALAPKRWRPGSRQSMRKVKHGAGGAQGIAYSGRRSRLGSWLVFLVDEPGDHGLQRHFADPVLARALEVDPALVEAVNHADPRHRVLHALRTE